MVSGTSDQTLNFKGDKKIFVPLFKGSNKKQIYYFQVNAAMNVLWTLFRACLCLIRDPKFSFCWSWAGFRKELGGG